MPTEGTYRHTTTLSLFAHAQFSYNSLLATIRRVFENGFFAYALIDASLQNLSATRCVCFDVHNETPCTYLRERERERERDTLCFSVSSHFRFLFFYKSLWKGILTLLSAVLLFVFKFFLFFRFISASNFNSPFRNFPPFWCWGINYRGRKTFMSFRCSLLLSSVLSISLSSLDTRCFFFLDLPFFLLDLSLYLHTIHLSSLPFFP